MTFVNKLFKNLIPYNTKEQLKNKQYKQLNNKYSGKVSESN